MATRSEIQSLLAHPGNLFALVWRFNVDPSSYADSSHFQNLGIPSELIPRFRSSRSGQRLLSKRLLEKRGLINQACLEFSDPRQRLALVDKATILRLIPYAGAAIYSNSIAKVLSREERSTLIQQIGPGAYQFGLQRSAFPNWESGLLKPFLKNHSIEASSSLASQIFQAGQWCIETCLSGEPFALTERFLLKFPVTTPSSHSSTSLFQTIPSFNFMNQVGREEREKVWQYIYRVLTKEISPNWISCFN